eukprot:73595_1
MNLWIIKLASRFQTPSSMEGYANALTLISHLIRCFDSNENIKHQESKPSTTKNSTITTISHSNIHSIDTQHVTQFTSKTRQMIKELQTLECISWRFKPVPSGFYAQDLEQRAKHILRAPSVKYLCKSLLMKNTKCVHNDCGDRLNSKYYLVLFQYDQKLKQQKLKKFVKNLSNKSNKYYKFSLASLEETYELTEFEYNCVSPVGIGNIPIIVSHHIMNGEMDYIWIGSGSLHLKLSISVHEFSQKFNHFVADITH